MFELSERSKLRLESVHPLLVSVVYRAVHHTKVDFAVLEGLRAPERQAHLVSIGASRTLQSLHLRQTDGFAHAVDLVACGDLNRDGEIDARDRRIVWERDHYIEIAAGMFKAAKQLQATVRWGGYFRGFFDGPHFEIRGAL